MAGIEMEQKGVAAEHKGDPTVGISFASSEGQTLRSHKWIPQGPVKALVFYLHGYLDHVTMPGIVNLAESLKADGYAVFGMDDQGHGESDGLRGWVLLPKAHDDLLKFIGLVKKDYPNLPFYIIGHSMGGLLTTLLGITLTTKNPDPLFKGAVMLAAAYRYVDVPPPPAVKFLIWISQCCPTWQCICVPSPPDSKIFKDADNIRNHAKDPLKIDVAVRLGFGAAFMTAMSDMDAHPERVTYPFLAITGDDDKVIDYRGSVDLHKKAATPQADKEIIVYKGAYHDLLHDTVKDQVVPAIKAWLNKRGGH